MARCYLCDYSPGNESLFRLSTTKPKMRQEGSGWVCSECSSEDTSLNIADSWLSEEDLLEEEPSTEDLLVSEKSL